MGRWRGMVWMEGGSGKRNGRGTGREALGSQADGNLPIPSCPLANNLPTLTLSNTTRCRRSERIE